MQTTLKVLGLLIKLLSLVGGLASYSGMLPEKYEYVAVIAFAVGSVLKDGAIHIGDILDDGQQNNSFKV